MCVRNLSMYHAWARIFMNALLVSGRGMCLSLGLKCLYFSVPTHAVGLPWEAVSLLPHTCRVQFPLMCSISTMSWSPARILHVCVCIWWPVLIRVRSRRGAGSSFASHVYLLVFVKWMNRVGWLHREQPFFSALLQLLVQGSVSLQGSWGGSLREDHGTFWRIYIVTLIALRYDLRKTSQLEERGSVS